LNREEILENFQNAHNKYFELLMKNYPGYGEDKDFGDFGPVPIYDLAIEVHACAAALGANATRRLRSIGLDFLYPFDNPVDLYTWRVKVKEEGIRHTTFAAIAIRIDSELQRMRRILELGGATAYDGLAEDAFISPQVRNQPRDQLCGNEDPPVAGLEVANCRPSTQVMVLPPDTDHQAVSRLERLEATSSIGANVSAIISFLRSFVTN